MERSVWIGFDPREADGYAVTRTSLQTRAITPLPTFGLVLETLRQDGFYTRPTTRTPDGLLYDPISEHTMATEFAISRFLVPELARRMSSYRKMPRWALFMDSDMLVLDNLNRLFDMADEQYAVMVVQHNYQPTEGVKMDGQIQSQYARKNWSSVVLFNIDHPANGWLTVENVNRVPGRDLHRFCWLDDRFIGELSPRWNYLVGHNSPHDLEEWGDNRASIVHFTEGLPSMKGYETNQFADRWWQELRSWAK